MEKHEQNRLEFQVTGMHCNKCVAHVTRALSDLDEVNSVAVSLEGGQVSIEPATVSKQRILDALIREGYSAEF